jgi:hypothetical protein
MTTAPNITDCEEFRQRLAALDSQHAELLEAVRALQAIHRVNQLRMLTL